MYATAIPLSEFQLLRLHVAQVLPVKFLENYDTFLESVFTILSRLLVLPALKEPTLRKLKKSFECQFFQIWKEEDQRPYTTAYVTKRAPIARHAAWRPVQVGAVSLLARGLCAHIRLHTSGR